MTVPPNSLNFNNRFPPGGERYVNYANASDEERNNASAVVMLVRASDLKRIDRWNYRLAGKPLYERRTSLGNDWAEDFPFRTAHSSYAIGTGCFVGENMILTAAHLVFSTRENLAWEDLRFIRAYVTPEEEGIISDRQIYRPVERTSGPAHYRISMSAADWALIEVQPEANHDDEALYIPTVCSEELQPGRSVYGIGHGLGLKTKISNTGSSVLVNDISQPYFECNLPLFVSSSGTPVFCTQTHQLVGIVVRAVDQLQLVEDKICPLEQVSRFEGQECQRLKPILHLL